MAYDTQKLKGLFSRVYHDQMDINDASDIREYIKKVFGTGFNPDPSLLHQFNNLVVQQADEVAKPMVTNLIGLLANVRTVAKDTVVKYEIPKKSKTKVRWSANGSGVDLVRVENKEYDVAVPRTFATGFYYEPFGDNDAVERFRDLVNDVANAKVRLYLDEIMKIINAAIASTKIPANNVLQGANLTIQQYNKLASRIARYGGRPVFIADTLLIDYFAQQQVSDDNISKLLTDPVKEELLRSLNPTRIGRTDAVNLVNPFVDDQNTKVELPINVGYMLAGEGRKPFYVTEFGGMRQLTEQDIEDERIKMKIVQDADITLMYGQTIGIIKEDAAVSL